MPNCHRLSDLHEGIGEFFSFNKFPAIRFSSFFSKRFGLVKKISISVNYLSELGDKGLGPKFLNRLLRFRPTY